MTDQFAYGDQPVMPRAIGQTIDLPHVLVKAAQFGINHIYLMDFGLNTAISQNNLQMLQCGPDLVTAALHWIWAGTAWQMLLHEALRLLFKSAKIKSATSRPQSEVRDGAEICARSIRGVLPPDQAVPIGRHELRQGAVAQPLRWQRVNEIVCIHDDLLKWGCYHRRHKFLCKVQNRVDATLATAFVPIREARPKDFA